MNRPTLYVKHGCPYCAAAAEYLEQHGIAYDEINVRGNPEKMKELEDVSGQNLTPTLVWDGKVLANFDVDQLEHFLAEQHVGVR